MKPIQNFHSFINHKQFFKLFLLGIVVLALTSSVLALDGSVGTHDPTTIMECDGGYYAFGTGGATHFSEDGWTWGGGRGTPNGGGMGPDMIHIGDYYYMYTASNVGGQPASRIVMQKTKSLNPESPDYGWQNMGVVNTTDGVEFCNGIDPGCFYDKNTGKFWLTFGSYFGNIRVVEMDPETGLRIDMNKYYEIAINCEASTIIYHDGWYYLLATHGSCCRGADSGYNIRVGRAKEVTGPYVDHEGVEMMKGGGKQVIGSGERKIGPGHFGLFDEGNGVQKFSLHWEADLDRGGSSVIDVIPLVWEDGWPVAGEFVKEGTYEIHSFSTDTSLELAVEGQAVGRSGGGGGRGGAGGGAGFGGGNRGGAGNRGAGGARRGGAAGAVPGAGNIAGMMGGFGGGGMGGGRGGAGGGRAVADQDANSVSGSWPEGNIDIRMANYMCQAQQKWEITPAEGAGGYLGAPYYKILIAGTDRALAATEDCELGSVPSFTGSDEQLWRIEQFTDGRYRIMPKSIPGTSEPMALTAIGASSVTLAKLDPDSNKQRWLFKAP